MPHIEDVVILVPQTGRFDGALGRSHPNCDGFDGLESCEAPRGNTMMAVAGPAARTP